MNQPHIRQHLYSHPQESRQIWQASIVLLHTIRVKVKVALLGVVALLVAAILSSCGPVTTNSPSTPTLSPTSTSTPSPTATSSPPTETPTSPPGTASPIFVGDTLAPGYSMGVNTSGGLTNWVTVKSGEICMAYPSGQSWGAVFITVGEPKEPPRPGKDLSNYHLLSLELRGQAGKESVSIGLKDNTDLDTGNETKVSVSDLTSSWKSLTFPLSEFKTADLHRLYIVIEFVFAYPPETVCARNIQYIL